MFFFIQATNEKKATFLSRLEINNLAIYLCLKCACFVSQKTTRLTSIILQFSLIFCLGDKVSIEIFSNTICSEYQLFAFLIFSFFVKISRFVNVLSFFGGVNERKRKRKKFFISPKYLSHFNLKVLFQLFYFDGLFRKGAICMRNLIKCKLPFKKNYRI